MSRLAGRAKSLDRYSVGALCHDDVLTVDKYTVGEPD